MYISVKEFRGSCPSCCLPVSEVVVTSIQHMNTPGVKDLIGVYGHVACMVGVKWHMKCYAGPRPHMVRCPMAVHGQVLHALREESGPGGP